MAGPASRSRSRGRLAGCLYAETLANALAVHLLRRYAIGRHLDPPFHGGLTRASCIARSPISWRIWSLIVLAELAAVAQMSSAHARLFKGATGRRRTST